MPILNRLPRGGSGDGDTGNKMNIFVQPTVPDIKDGIWVQTYQINGLDIMVVSDMNDLPGDYDYTKMLDIPYEFYGGSTSVVGNDVYLFGSYDTTARKYCYKYDTTSNTYTKMLDIPYEFYYGPTSVVGTDIYLFGGSGGNTNCYKYNTILNTYTKMPDIPYEFYYGPTSVVGTDIYLFGGSNSTRKYCYKYNTTSNTYTKMLDIPYEFYGGSTSVVGNGVYLFGVSSSSDTQTNCYKYNTILNTYTKMPDIPYAFYKGSTSVVGDDVYLFGGFSISSTTQKYCYKYGKTIMVDDDAFIIVKTSEHDGLYQTQFFQPPEDINPDYMNRIVSGFDDALLYADSTIQNTLPTYYGNGTEWIKFKN